MVNIYKCEKRGWDGEINEKINVVGILYLDSCPECQEKSIHERGIF